MSGGHFDYRDNYLYDIIDKIKNDIEYNDVKWEDVNQNIESRYAYSDEYGYQSSKETIEYLEKLIKECKKCTDLLHAYDWYISGDTCEETFLEKCKELDL